MQTLLKLSEKWGNRKHVRILKMLSSVTVHAAFQKNYNEKLITAHLRITTNAPPVASTSRRSIILSFEFKTQCFLCAEEITAQFLIKQEKEKLSVREIIYQVEKLQVKDTILKAAEERCDKWGRQIIERINM